MKRFTIIAILLLIAAMPGIAQRLGYEKITSDLLEEINASSKSGEMFQTIIVMNEQFDAQKSTRQMQQFNKEQQRAFVMNELQMLSNKGQKEVMKDLCQGQKAALVKDIQSFWIINAVSCSMTKDMVLAIADRPDVKFIMKSIEIHVADGEVSDNNQLVRDENPWNVTQVNANDVWALGYTGAGIIVAVIDSGVNYNHTDIANNMWDGGSEYPYHGWDFINDDNNPMDDNGHGTHCAGTVSSYGTNGKQCGIAKDAKIMALKVLDANGHGNSNYIIPAIEFAVSHGADILSMSLGGNNGGFWPYRVALENVLHCGVIASVSAGNRGLELSTYPKPNNVGCPGSCPSPWRHPDQTLEGGHSAVVAVGATTKDDTHSSFSSYGPSTWAEGANIGFYNDYPWDNADPTKIGLIKPDISAPGSGIISLLHSSNDGYTSMDGTSMAAPCVAGVMALLLQANPTLTPVEIDSIIETTAIACEGQTSKNNTYGAGRIDALAAINYMLNVCAAPTSLAATVNEANVILNWVAAEGVWSYRIYRNEVMIAKTVSGTNFTDINAPAGNNTYFIRSNSDSYHASLPSNQVTVNVTTNAEFDAPSNLVATEINTAGNTLTLSWNAPAVHESTVYYVNSGNNYTGLTNTTITAAQRFPSSVLQHYAGMQIEHIFFSLYNSGATCTINLYEGEKMFPGEKVYEDSFTTTEAEQAVDYNLKTPIVINPNKDLWLTISTSDKILCDENYSGEIGDAFMYTYTSAPHWLSFAGKAWAFQLGLSTIGYSYNVYRNDITVSSNQDETSYTDSYTNGMNSYRVSAVSNGYESPASNTVMAVSNTASSDNLTVNSNDKLIILPNSTLSVGTLTNNGTETNLILENGAQLIHSNGNVAATVKKDIAPYTANDNGWYFIAPPVTETIEPSAVSGLLTTNTYDLYKFDQSQTNEWRNYKASSFSTLDHQTGYLYANSSNTTLTFEGTLAASTEATSLDYDEDAAYPGFNLIGNPYPCNTTIDRDFYIINGRTITLAETGTEIAPCEGVFVKATGNDETVTFNKVSTAKDNNAKNYFDLVVTQDKTTIDRARVRLGKGINMEKLCLDDKCSQMTLWQNGQDFAVAYANGANEMPISFMASQDGTYTISIEYQSLEQNYLHLIDNLTGIDIDLLATPNYTFEAKTSDYPSRFRLVFSICEDAVDDNAAFAYVNNGNIIVNQEGILQIVDMTGHVFYQRDAKHCVSTSGMVSGVYVLRLITTDGVKTQKIVIE